MVSDPHGTYSSVLLLADEDFEQKKSAPRPGLGLAWLQYDESNGHVRSHKSGLKSGPQACQACIMFGLPLVWTGPPLVMTC